MPKKDQGPYVPKKDRGPYVPKAINCTGPRKSQKLTARSPLRTSEHVTLCMNGDRSISPQPADSQQRAERKCCNAFPATEKAEGKKP